jgi:hypothetical protein
MFRKPFGIKVKTLDIMDSSYPSQFGAQHEKKQKCP